MLRGFFEGAMRCCRNFEMRTAIELSSASSCRRAASVNSIFQAKALSYFLEGVRFFFSRPDPFPNAFRLIKVLKILQVPQDRFPSIKGLCATGSPGQFVQAFFNRLRQSDR